MEPNTLLIASLAFQVVEGIVSHALIKYLMELDSEDNTIRKKLPEKGPTLKMRF